MSKRPYLAALAGVLMMGCDDVIAPSEVVIQVAPVDLHLADGYIAVMFDETLVDVWAGGQVLGSGPVVIATETPVGVTATFHDPEGNRLMEGFDAYQFLLRPLDPELLRFARTDAFAGKLTRIAPGRTALEVGLYNVETQTLDFGPFPVPVTAK